MNDLPAKISLSQWDSRYERLDLDDMSSAGYIGPLGRRLDCGDSRLACLEFDNSPAALRLWNFLLTENERLATHRSQGKKLVGVMKDLGTSAALAYCFGDLVAFYPDGAWWIPCTMEMSDGLLVVADSMGFDESFCPVRAMLGAFATGNHFPQPDLLTCSVGAICDDFSAVVQQLESMGHKIFWWELPVRHDPNNDDAVCLANGINISESQLYFVQRQLQRIAAEFEKLSSFELSDELLRKGISAANDVRRKFRYLRDRVYSARKCPLGSLEMMIAEMAAIHYCSDMGEVSEVLDDLIAEVDARIVADVGILPAEAVKIFWVNPVADLRMMNLLEDCGGRLAGTEFMFSHALSDIDESLPPMRALAAAAMSDPMIGSSRQRAEMILQQIEKYSAEAVVISRIPGASHCAMESSLIEQYLREKIDLPIIEIEVPVLIDSMLPALRTRLEALMESVLERRKETNII